MKNQMSEPTNMGLLRYIERLFDAVLTLAVHSSQSFRDDMIALHKRVMVELGDLPPGPEPTSIPCDLDGNGYPVGPCLNHPYSGTEGCTSESSPCECWQEAGDMDCQEYATPVVEECPLPSCDGAANPRGCLGSLNPCPFKDLPYQAPETPLRSEVEVSISKIVNVGDPLIVGGKMYEIEAIDGTEQRCTLTVIPRS